MWITLTEDDVLTRLSGPEVPAYKTAALAQGQTNPLPEIMNSVVKEVRGFIGACKENKLGDGDTIPDELKMQTLAIIVYKFITRLPVKVSQERVDDKDDAYDIFRQQVATCKFAIEAPATPSDEVISSPTPRIKKRCLQFSREKQEGV